MSNPFTPDTDEYVAWELGGAAQAEQPDERSLEQATRQLTELQGAEQITRARELAALAANLPVLEQQAWRDVLKDVAGMRLGDFDAIVRAERKVKKDREKEDRERAWAEEAERQRLEHAFNAQRSDVIPPPDQPLTVARTVIKRIAGTDGVPHWSWWRGDFYTWTGSRWDVLEATEVQHWLYKQTEHAYFQGEGGLAPWAPNMTRIRHLEHALGVGALNRPAAIEPDQVIACRNGVLNIGSRHLRGHHPRCFNLHSLPFDFDAEARCTSWTKFLDEVLPGDLEAIEFIQEWFGYVISGRTDLQKMASLVGPPRSGKGTIARVLHALLGAESVSSPTLGALAGQFGRQALIGKRLAILSDVRWNSRNATDATEPLLAITGEDAQDVPRKNREDWHGKLGVRFMAMSNDVPTFKDASTALANRMIHIEFTRSFLGREDPGLTDRLLGELPGILNWALDGLDRLTQRGSFVGPTSGNAVADEVRRASSPYAAYVEDRCELVELATVELDALFADYCSWCDDEARDHKGTKEAFSRGLQSAFRGQITTDRRMENGVRRRLFVGVQRLPGVTIS